MELHAFQILVPQQRNNILQSGWRYDLPHPITDLVPNVIRGLTLRTLDKVYSLGPKVVNDGADGGAGVNAVVGLGEAFWSVIEVFGIGGPTSRNLEGGEWMELFNTD